MNASDQNKIIVAVSGGVDSAVAALTLVRAGYDVAGLHMTNWEDDEGYCTAADDLRDAQTICDDIGITLHTVNFSKEYKEQVFADFLAEYRRGRTPNPDVLCNREIKFGVFLDYARRLGADRIATGHYARTSPGIRCRLLKARDRSKDQTYFLHQVPSEALAQSIFPLGDLTKTEVRRLANEAGLPVFNKKDSTGICFIGERPFRDFLSQYLSGAAGEIRSTTGRVVGEHDGLMYYTLGQRQGLGIGGIADLGPDPWFVAGKDHDNNTLIVAQGRDDPALWYSGMKTESPVWVTGTPKALAAGSTLRCSVKTRYRQDDMDCSVRIDGAGSLRVDFDEPQWAVTPGQYAVFYLGEECLGGAAIDSAWHAEPAVADRGLAPL